MTLLSVYPGCRGGASGGGGISSGLDDEGKAVDAAHKYSGPGRQCRTVTKGGLPQLAADFHLSVGGQRCLGDCDCAHHRLRAGEDFAAAGAKSNPGEAEGDGSEAYTRSNRG